MCDSGKGWQEHRPLKPLRWLTGYREFPGLFVAAPLVHQGVIKEWNLTLPFMHIVVLCSHWLPPGTEGTSSDIYRSAFERVSITNTGAVTVFNQPISVASKELPKSTLKCEVMTGMKHHVCGWVWYSSVTHCKRKRKLLQVSKDSLQQTTNIWNKVYFLFYISVHKHFFPQIKSLDTIGWKQYSHTFSSQMTCVRKSTFTKCWRAKSESITKSYDFTTRQAFFLYTLLAPSNKRFSVENYHLCRIKTGWLGNAWKLLSNLIWSQEVVLPFIYFFIQCFFFFFRKTDFSLIILH